MPVVTVGGTAGFGADLKGEIRPLVKRLRAVMIENCGHLHGGRAARTSGEAIAALLRGKRLTESHHQFASRAGRRFLCFRNSSRAIEVRLCAALNASSARSVTTVSMVMFSAGSSRL